MSRIVPQKALSQSYETFGNRGAPTPLIPHISAGQKVCHILPSKLEVYADFLTLTS